jgi:hypothetical protein
LYILYLIIDLIYWYISFISNLCFNYIGICELRSRNKYSSKRFLKESEKALALRESNKLNARLTRKRRKLYNEFLERVQIDLIALLNADAYTNKTTSATVVCPK